MVDEDSTLREEIPEKKEPFQSIPPKYLCILRIVEGPDKGQVFTLAPGNYILGRTHEGLTFNDPHISRKHAALDFLSPENCYLKDLASTNGTFVNDRAIDVCKIAQGDLIRLGQKTLIKVFFKS